MSRQAQSIRFRADDEALRPMGRATSGVMGIRLRGDDELLAMVVANDDEAALMVVTDGGFGKRTRLSEYKQQGRGGSGVLTAAIAEKRGQLVGALVVRETDEVFAVTSSGVVIRVPVEGLRLLSRATGGVKLISVEAGSDRGVRRPQRRVRGAGRARRSRRARRPCRPTSCWPSSSRPTTRTRASTCCRRAGRPGVPGADDEDGRPCGRRPRARSSTTTGPARARPATRTGRAQ